ncbi:ABC transporter [Paenibacillus sp. PK3_47]|nr:ABC transporter [Paenibacillus sp. PK3_47]
MQTNFKLPEPFRRQVREPLLLECTADLDPEGCFGEQWIAVSGEKLIVWHTDEAPRIHLPLAEITDARAVSAVGGGALHIDTDFGPVVAVRYTAALTPLFDYAAKLIKAAAQGEELPVLSERDLPRSCPHCGNPLDEGMQICAQCMNKGKLVIRMLGYAKPYKLQMMVAGVLLILTTLVELIPPYLTKIMIDDVLGAAGKGTRLLAVIGGLGLTILVMAAMQAVRGLIGIWVGSKLMGDFRKDIFSALMKLSLAFFDRRQTTQFIGRVNNDAEAMRQFLTDGVIYVIGQLLRFVAVLLILFSLDWKLTLFALIPVPFMVLLSMKIWPKIGRLAYQQWRSILRLNMLVGDSLQGIRVVKAFGRERTEMSRYERTNTEVVHNNLRMEGMWQFIFPIFSLVTGAGTLLIWYHGGNKVLEGTLQLGTLMALLSYLGMLFGPLGWIQQMINWTSTAMAAAYRVFEVLDTVPEVMDVHDPVPIGTIKGDVAFTKVTYGYEKHNPVLKEIDLQVKSGEMIGLVGHSGAGKSTFINLLCRFYDTDEGSISIDGIPIRSISQTDLRKQIGVVLQETFLFEGSIAENIAYAKPEATPEDIMRAAKIANAHDFIVRMPDGYDTQVGERGHKLSGGEKQRVAIARAVIHDPRILILDEATASVDTETERQIQEAIARLVQGRTTFAIAHRLSTLRNADRLVVLDKGRITEVGTHEELLNIPGGIYRKLVDAQQELSKIKGVEV